MKRGEKLQELQKGLSGVEKNLSEKITTITKKKALLIKVFQKQGLTKDQMLAKGLSEADLTDTFIEPIPTEVATETDNASTKDTNKSAKESTIEARLTPADPLINVLSLETAVANLRDTLNTQEHSSTSIDKESLGILTSPLANMIVLLINKVGSIQKLGDVLSHYPYEQRGDLKKLLEDLPHWILDQKDHLPLLEGIITSELALYEEPVKTPEGDLKNTEEKANTVVAEPENVPKTKEEKIAVVKAKYARERAAVMERYKEALKNEMLMKNEVYKYMYQLGDKSEKISELLRGEREDYFISYIEFEIGEDTEKLTDATEDEKKYLEHRIAEYTKALEYIKETIARYDSDKPGLRQDVPAPQLLDGEKPSSDIDVTKLFESSNINADLIELLGADNVNASVTAKKDQLDKEEQDKKSDSSEK